MTGEEKEEVEVEVEVKRLCLLFRCVFGSAFSIALPNVFDGANDWASRFS